MSKTQILLPYLGRWNQFRKSRFHQIAERLVERNFEVHVVQTPETESDEVLFRERNVNTPDGIVLHEAKLKRSLWNSRYANKVFQKGYYGLGVHSQINRLIETHSIDLLWLYNLPHYFLALTADIPVIFDYVDDYVAMLNSELSILDNSLTERAEYFFFSHIIQSSDLVFSVSHELAKKVDEMAGSKTHCEILPNGVDDGIFPVTEDVRRPQLHTPPTVGFVGAFEYFIDFDMILKAANRLSGVRFLLVGDGREYDYVERIVSEWGLDNIELTGLVESQEVPDYIEQMDVCLNVFKRVPVAHSAVPLKLFEYLSLCRPVVSTRVKEVQHIDSGYLYYADTPQDLAGTIETILANYSDAVDRTLLGKEAVQDSYDWDVIADDFINGLQKHGLA